MTKVIKIFLKKNIYKKQMHVNNVGKFNGKNMFYFRNFDRIRRVTSHKKNACDLYRKDIHASENRWKEGVGGYYNIHI